MVRFYRTTFKNVRINRALRQKFDALLLARFFFEYTDKFCTDDFTLFLRLCDAFKLVQEAVDRVYIDKVCIHLIAKQINNLLRLAFAKQTMVYMNTYKLFANCFN